MGLIFVFADSVSHDSCQSLICSGDRRRLACTARVVVSSMRCRDAEERRRRWRPATEAELHRPTSGRTPVETSDVGALDACLDAEIDVLAALGDRRGDHDRRRAWQSNSTAYRNLRNPAAYFIWWKDEIVTTQCHSRTLCTSNDDTFSSPQWTSVQKWGAL